jgi:hypothetical protein
VQVPQKAWNLLSDEVKASLQRAESNLNALNTVDLGPKRPFSVGECALWVRLTGPQLAAQVAAAVSLAEAPANHCKTSTVTKEVMVIMPDDRTDSFSARCKNREGHSPLAINTAAFVHVLVLLAAGFALCFGESINLT